MRRGRPKAPLSLSREEQEMLAQWATRSGTPAPLAERARILLACGDGESNKDIADRYELTPQTVGKWRARFLKARLDGLLDEPRSGAPRRILDADVERVLVLTLESAGPDGSPWSTRSLAQATDLSQSAISRIWRAHGVRPHRGEASRFWADPRFVEQVRDVVGLYADPPTFALALCASARALPSIGRVQPSASRGELSRDGRVAIHDSILSGLPLPAGRLRSVEERRDRNRDFRHFLEQLDDRIPRGLDVHVLMARDGTLESSIVQSWLAGRPRFQAHPIAPRLPFEDLVERWLTLVSKRNGGSDPDSARRPLERAAQRHRQRHAESPAPFVWVKAVDEIARREA